MKVFGHIRNQKEESPSELQEVSFSGTSEQIREVARFLEHAAELMDKFGDRFGHEHASDTVEHWASSCDVIVSGKPAE